MAATRGCRSQARGRGLFPSRDGGRHSLRGGMGLVFEAEHLRLKSRVAVKVLPQHLVGDHYALARFRHEAEIIAQLKHPHIVQVIDFDATEENHPYLVMELLTGESLAVRLEREQRLPLHVATRIAAQTASALASVHQSTIVHRDLKPANIFLCLLYTSPSPRD